MSTDYRGKFKQGATPNLLVKLAEMDGTLIDPVEMVCIISGPLENVSLEKVISGTPFQATNGFYVFEWEIDDDQTPGTYQVDWEYQYDGEEKHIYHIVTVVEDIDAPTFYTDRVLAMREALEYHLNCAQSIPVYSEQAKSSRDRSIFEFSFSNWNQSAGVRIYRNQEIMTDNVEVDWFKGRVTFEEALLAQDTINADYNFRWFSDDELNRFLGNAVQTVNTFPPASSYYLEDIPDRFIPTVLYGAAKDALRQLMMCLQFQQPQQIFGSPEEAQKAFASMEALKKNYAEDWKLLCEQKKYGPYPATRLIVVPEYTLPGGRCLSPDITALIAINEGFGDYNFNNVYTLKGNRKTSVCDVEIKVYTLKDIYRLFKQGYNMEILSHSNITGNLIFSPINHIWQSGFKTVYELKTINGYSILSSDEHLFYINGQYIPLMDIKIGDEVITSDNHNIEISRVKSIKQLKRKQEMLDLEVFETANLFASGIKCHNSRWFRYLFKIIPIAAALFCCL